MLGPTQLHREGIIQAQAQEHSDSAQSSRKGRQDDPTLVLGEYLNRAALDDDVERAGTYCDIQQVADDELDASAGRRISGLQNGRLRREPSGNVSAKRAATREMSTAVTAQPASASAQGSCETPFPAQSAVRKPCSAITVSSKSSLLAGSAGRPR